MRNMTFLFRTERSRISIILENTVLPLGYCFSVIIRQAEQVRTSHVPAYDLEIYSCIITLSSLFLSLLKRRVCMKTPSLHSTL